jgi:Glycosyltransferase family 87
MRLNRARLAVVLAAVAAVQLVALLHWTTNFGSQVGEDFDVHWAATRLLATGHRGDMFSLAAQLRAVHAGGVTGVTWLNHAVWPPVALLTVLPLTVLPLPLAIGAWTVLQAAALVAAIVLAAGDRAALWSKRSLAAAAALATPGLAALLALGQWEGFAALLVVLTWRDMEAGRRRRGALWMLLLAGAKPQIALGLLVFQVALWGWRQLRTLALGGAALAAASVLLLGVDGFRAWTGQLLDVAGQGRAADADGLNGLVAAVAGGGPIATALTVAASAAALTACWVLARRARAAAVPALLPATALAATALSLLTSPHLFDYGVVALAPLLVAALLRGAAGSAQRTVLALLWGGLGLLTVSGLHVDHAWWRPAVPLALMAMAATALPARAARRLGYALRW